MGLQKSVKPLSRDNRLMPRVAGEESRNVFGGGEALMGGSEPGESDMRDADAVNVAERRRALDGAIRRNDSILVKWLTAKFKDPETARDIAQSTYVRVLRFAERSEIDNPRALLFKTAANLAANEFRARRRARPVIVVERENSSRDLIEMVASDAPSPERAAQARHDLRLSLAAIEEMPTKVRRAFVASRFEGKNYREIASDMNVSESSVEKYIITALKTLRRALEQTEPPNVVPFARPITDKKTARR